MLQIASRLRTRLILMSLLAVAPALAAIAYSQWAERRSARNRTFDETRRLARLAASEQASHFDGVRRLLQTLAVFPAISRGTDPRPCNELLPSVLHDHADYFNISVFMATGAQFCTAVAPDPRLTVTVSARPWFRRAMQTRATALGDYQTSLTTGKPAIIMAHPIVGPDGRVDRVVAASIALQSLTHLASRAALPAGATATLVDRTGTIVARFPNGDRWIGRHVADQSIQQQLKSRAREDLRERTGIDGIQRLYVSVPVDATLDTGLALALGIDRATAFAEADGLLRQYAWLLALVALAVIGAALVGGEVFVLRPVHAFETVTGRIAAGDFGARVHLAAGVPGLPDLGRAIDAMAAALERQQRERDQADRARRALEEQLQQAQKMEAVGQLAGGIAHDFNNVLTVIGGHAEFLRDALPEGDRRRADADEVLRGARRAAQLTHQLLAFSRKQTLAPRIIYLSEIVRDVISMLRRVVGAPIELKTIARESNPVRADAGQMEQVLMNLAINARDAMLEGGVLTIETTDVSLDDTEARRYPTMEPGHYVRLAVSDTGCGMDATTLQRIFEPFFTTKPKGSGTGLGLAMVYGIVKQNGGHVWVSSTVGHGTTLTVYLPRAEPMGDEERVPRQVAPTSSC